MKLLQSLSLACLEPPRSPNSMHLLTYDLYVVLLRTRLHWHNLLFQISPSNSGHVISEVLIKNGSKGRLIMPILDRQQRLRLPTARDFETIEILKTVQLRCPNMLPKSREFDVATPKKTQHLKRNGKYRSQNSIMKTHKITKDSNGHIDIIDSLATMNIRGRLRNEFHHDNTTAA